MLKTFQMTVIWVKVLMLSEESRRRWSVAFLYWEFPKKSQHPNSTKSEAAVTSVQDGRTSKSTRDRASVGNLFVGSIPHKYLCEMGNSCEWLDAKADHYSIFSDIRSRHYNICQRIFDDDWHRLIHYLIYFWLKIVKNNSSELPKHCNFGCLLVRFSIAGLTTWGVFWPPGVLYSDLS